MAKVSRNSKATRWLMVCKLVLVLGGAAILASGCSTAAGTGTLIGAGSGAALGSLAGAALGHGHHRDEAAAVGGLIGAATGAGAGYVIGSGIDKNREQDARINQALQEASTTIINVHNTNGSITPVKLVRQGNVWVGPRGETYTTIPTEEQLTPVYGF